jgi:diaminopimelate decarboxylase
MAAWKQNISVGHIDDKFNSVHQMPFARIVENTKMHINGIHIHWIRHLEMFYMLPKFYLSCKNFKEFRFS